MFTPNPQYELTWPIEQQKVELTGLADEIQTILSGIYPIDFLPFASEYVWDGSLKSLEMLLGQTAERTYQAATFSVILDNAAHSIIFLDESIKHAISHTSPKDLFQQPVFDYLQSVIEEVSHFVLNHYYFAMHGELPSRAHAELQATIDRYLVTQQLSVKQRSRTLNKPEQLAAYDANVAYHQFGSAQTGRDPNYMIGHSFGEQFISVLNQIIIGGNDPTDLVALFYRLSERDKISFLLEDQGLCLTVYKKQEEDAFRAYLQGLGIPWNESYIKRTSFVHSSPG